MKGEKETGQERSTGGAAGSRRRGMRAGGATRSEGSGRVKRTRKKLRPRVYDTSMNTAMSV